jgi:photosystem II stability/assembly factor-like uncharacterized protein
MNINFKCFILILAAVPAALLFFTGCAGTGGTPITYNDIVWVVGTNTNESGTILKTVNSGTTWTRQGTVEIPDVPLSDVIALSSDIAWVVGGNDSGSGTVFKTTDGGDTWTRQGSGEIPDVSLYAITATSTLTAWAVGDSGVMIKTVNGGANWATQESGTSVQLQGIKASNDSIVWAAGSTNGGYAVILKTVNGGASWVRQGPAGIPDYVLIKITAVGTQVAWAVGSDRTIVRTGDGGVTWEDQSFGHPPSSADSNNIIAFDPNIAWIANDAGVVYYTTDAGGTWEGRNTDTGGYYMLGIDAVSQSRGWSVGTNYAPTAGNIIFTDNGGTSWTRQITWDVGLSGVSAVGGYRQ